MTSSDDTEQNYAVGYGRPPTQHRFRKGHSGNPNGKKHDQRTLKAELAAELEARITVTENGKTRKMSKLSVIVKRMVADAAKGDARAREQLIRLIGQIEQAHPAPGADPIGQAKDSEILNRFKLEIIKKFQEVTHD